MKNWAYASCCPHLYNIDDQLPIEFILYTSDVSEFYSYIESLRIHWADVSSYARWVGKSKMDSSFSQLDEKNILFKIKKIKIPSKSAAVTC